MGPKMIAAFAFFVCRPRNRAIFSRKSRRADWLTRNCSNIHLLHSATCSESSVFFNFPHFQSFSYLLVDRFKGKVMNDESVKVTKEEDEYVLIDLDDVARHIDIPSDAPYTLSGLDTLNPVLTIDGKLKLVGEYLETIGTCLAFSDKEVLAAENQTPRKSVEPVAKLHKILKFRLAFDNEDGETRGNNL